jgi:hypothetical protein
MFYFQTVFQFLYMNMISQQRLSRKFCQIFSKTTLQPWTSDAEGEKWEETSQRWAGPCEGKSVQLLYVNRDIYSEFSLSYGVLSVQTDTPVARGGGCDFRTPCKYETRIAARLHRFSSKRGTKTYAFADYIKKRQQEVCACLQAH